MTLIKQHSENHHNPVHIYGEESNDPTPEKYDPTISDSERIRRANRRFEERQKREIELNPDRQ